MSIFQLAKLTGLFTCLSSIRKQFELAITIALFAGVNAVHAQMLQTTDDAFGIPANEYLVIDAPGILDNDTLDGESAGESGATAVLVTNVSHGVLSLSPDGSFTYSPGATFDGSDHFVYKAVFGAVSSQATVTLTACIGGPTLFRCWNENAFFALAAEHKLPSFQEGFEDEFTWGATRAPDTAPTVSSRGFEWRANDFDPTHTASPFPPTPPINELRTAGPSWTPSGGASANALGAGGGYSPLEGNIFACDVPTPPIACYKHGGFTIKRETGSATIHGAGAYFNSVNTGGSIAFVLDGDWQNPYGSMGFLGNHQRFFGVLDISNVGFNEIQFREIAGVVGDPFSISADDFTVLAEPNSNVVAVPSMSVLGGIALSLMLFGTGFFKLEMRRKVRSHI